MAAQPRNPGSVPVPARSHLPAALPALVVLGLSALLAAGCERRPGDVAGAEGRETELVGRAIDWNASSDARFGSDRQATAAGAPTPSTGLGWVTPAGWSELPGSALRLANFRVAGDEHAECYLTSLTGEGGGLAANINRWRQQMAQAPLDEAAIAALPRVPWMGGQAVFLEIDGTFGGMSGDGAAQDSRLAGLLLVQPQKSWFLKMTGPRALIAGQTPAFHALASSLREGAADPHAAGAPAGPAHGEPGHVHGQGEPAADSERGASYAWKAPAGWMRGPEKSMREVTYLSGEQNAVECYVSELAGDGGGLASNLNRWRQQVGQPPFSEAELQALQRFPMLGGEAVLVAIPRAESATSGPEMVLGAVCLLEGRSVFVKMNGPRAAVEAQRAAFAAFCGSLKEAR